jgi:hypothetical protein
MCGEGSTLSGKRGCLYSRPSNYLANKGAD